MEKDQQELGFSLDVDKNSDLPFGQGFIFGKLEELSKYKIISRRNDTFRKEHGKIRAKLSK
ncbi:hypothetical protein NE619_09055 [Anaerovorax odorimutans]|uniref:Uncharacterized protein n=1 Tax=Anaerovorax odorimutans TaxID=109327 RepID=A0ABT1RNY2_9FIRM|nr:hypothetical protein [Anaerovorax odorimutans]MCQ4636878.1 hypothetical protein [Anaerovorax odorimutans]